MAALQNNYSLKAFLIDGDVTEAGVSLMSANGYTVQQIHYDCCRQRNASGFPYGFTRSACLEMTLRVATNESSKVFFDRMVENEPFPYSFLYDVSFSKMKQLSTFEDAMVATGYVVDVEETYENSPLPDGTADQMLIHVKLLLTNITYVGRDTNLTLRITND